MLTLAIATLLAQQPYDSTQRAVQLAQEARIEFGDGGAADPKEIAKDKRRQQEVLSGRFCYWRGRRQAALDEIATEKKYSKLGGVIDAVKMKRLQDDVRTCDEHLAQHEKNQKDLKISKLLPCDEARVAVFLACLKTDDRESTECATGAAAELLAFEAALAGP